MEKQAIIDAIRDCLDNNDWNYEYDAEHSVIHFGIRIRSKIKNVKIIIDVSDNSYVVYTYSPINADPNDLSEILRYLAQANYGLRNGNFELDVKDGEIRYKVFVNCNNIETLPERVILDSVCIPCHMFDRYGDGFAALAMGFSDAKTEIEKAEKDTEPIDPPQADPEED
ncbi:MAG: hypothetical protein IJU44_09945 [Kiritimatiellae bacterium]|nr:hypothetical protein [Kiritimatiellia bacterium]